MEMTRKVSGGKFVTAYFIIGQFTPQKRVSKDSRIRSRRFSTVDGGGLYCSFAVDVG
jgi:hypothetical protein